MPDTYAQQLALAKEQLSAILATPIEEYQTIEGSGGQRVRHIKIQELRDNIDWLEKKVAQGTGTRVRRALAIINR